METNRSASNRLHRGPGAGFLGVRPVARWTRARGHGHGGVDLAHLPPSMVTSSPWWTCSTEAPAAARCGNNRGNDPASYPHPARRFDSSHVNRRPPLGRRAYVV